MQTHRFLVKPEEINDFNFKTTNPELINKALRVLRLSPGTSVELFDGEGKLYKATIKTISEEVIEADIQEIAGSQENKKISITLAQGLPKGSKLDDIIRMNTEVGVDAFMLFDSEYSVLKAKDFKENKLVRLKKLSEEAARQSERPIVPTIQSPIEFNDLMNLTFDHKLLFHSRIVDRTINIKDLDLNGNVLVVIGTEGGFSDNEINLARDNKFAVVHMDLPILRTETAGIVAASILLS